MLVSEKKRSFCERSDMNEKSFVSFVADTYLENCIQNIKYSVNHEESNRSGFPDAADAHLYAGGCRRKPESRYSLNICEREKRSFSSTGYGDK